MQVLPLNVPRRFKAPYRKIAIFAKGAALLAPAFLLSLAHEVCDLEGEAFAFGGAHARWVAAIFCEVRFVSSRNSALRAFAWDRNRRGRPPG
jgi:hypothetical protein